jgi:pantothenate kinase
VKPLLDYSLFVHVDRKTAGCRLLKRHGEEGLFSEERNRAHIERNDLPNYDLVEKSKDRADVILSMDVEH